MGRKPRPNSKPNALCGLFGDTVQVRVLNHFLFNGGIDHSPTEIAKACNVDRVSVHRVLPNLIKQGIVRRTRRVGQASMYGLNSKNPLVQSFQKWVMRSR